MSDAKSGVKWESVRLGDVCEIMMGQSPPGSSYNSNGIGEPLLNGPTEFGDIFPSPVQWTTEPYRFAEPGDILFCVRGATTGRKNKADRRYCIGRGLAAIRAKPERASIEFLYHALDYVTSELIKEAAGSTFPNLPGAKLRNFELLLPPLDEQRRIVAIIDEQMAAVEEARAAAEAQLRASEELAAAYLREVFEGEEAGGWPTYCVEQIADVQGGIQKTPARTPVGFHRPYVTVRNVQRGRIDFSDLQSFELTPEELERYRLEDGDILFVEGNGSINHIGRCALYSGEIEDCVHQNHIIRVRPDQVRLVPQFISLYFNSDAGKAQMVERARTTSGLYTLSVAKIKSLILPVPPLELQRQVVAAITGQLGDGQAMHEALRESYRLIEALSAAILRQAFSGEL